MMMELWDGKLDYDFGFLTANISASYNSSANKLDKSPVLNFNQTAALHGGAERLNIVPEDLTYLLTDYKGANEVVLRNGNLFSNNYKDKKYIYKADFQVPFNIGNSASGFLKFGGQYDRQIRKRLIWDLMEVLQEQVPIFNPT